MSIIRMKYPFLDEIAKYAKEHLPEEACGLIAGSEDENGRLITKVYYLTNTDHAEDHFTMDPKEQLAAMIMSLMAENPVINSFHIEGGQVTKEDLRIYSDEYYF